jgi:hypothetical protein
MTMKRHAMWLANARWCRERGHWRSHAENLRMAALAREAWRRRAEIRAAQLLDGLDYRVSIGELRRMWRQP